MIGIATRGIARMAILVSALFLLVGQIEQSICFADEADPNMVVNGGFEAGLSGWMQEGAGTAGAPATGMVAKEAVHLGPGKGTVRQQYVIHGLRIVRFAATLKTDPPGLPASVRAECYDAHGRLVMDLGQSLDPKKNDPKGSEVGLYFKTQAHTARLVISIQKDSNQPGIVYATNAVLNDYDKDTKYHAPTCDLHQYMHPMWEGHTVYNETVLLVSHNGYPATGDLLFTPTRIISVENYGLTQTFQQGRDYTVSGRTITCAPSSRMPTIKDSDSPAGDFPWQVTDGEHVVVTYTHDDVWRGPTPHYVGDKLPHTMLKLAQRAPMTVVAYGDSITLGLDTSSNLGIPPYMPTWAELFVNSLKQRYEDPHITLYNTALGGMTSEWGLENVDYNAGDLKPDLVITAFGMNDFWSLTGDEFKANIQGIIHAVRKKQPQAEFILVSSMQFDPAYTADPTYSGHMADYAAALKSLCGEGVQCLDMYSISGALYAAKKPKDFIGNPLHPNDFLARWYAQGLTAMLTKLD